MVSIAHGGFNDVAACVKLTLLCQLKEKQHLNNNTISLRNCALARASWFSLFNDSLTSVIVH